MARCGRPGCSLAAVQRREVPGCLAGSVRGNRRRSSTHRASCRLVRTSRCPLAATRSSPAPHLHRLAFVVRPPVAVSAGRRGPSGRPGRSPRPPCCPPTRKARPPNIRFSVSVRLASDELTDALGEVLVVGHATIVGPAIGSASPIWAGIVSGRGSSRLPGRIPPRDGSRPDRGTSEGRGVDLLAEQGAADRLVELGRGLDVLGRDVGVAQAALQHARLVDRRAAGERVTRCRRQWAARWAALAPARRIADPRSTVTRVAGARTRPTPRPTSSSRNARADRSPASALASSIWVNALLASVRDENCGAWRSPARSARRAPAGRRRARGGDAGGEQREVRERAERLVDVGARRRTVNGASTARRRRRPRNRASRCRAGRRVPGVVELHVGAGEEAHPQRAVVTHHAADDPRGSAACRSPTASARSR